MSRTFSVAQLTVRETGVPDGTERPEAARNATPLAVGDGGSIPSGLSAPSTARATSLLRGWRRSDLYPGGEP